MLVSDALGVPYEFHERDEIPSLAEIEFTPPPGLRDGVNAIPERWRNALRGKELYEVELRLLIEWRSKR